MFKKITWVLVGLFLLIQFVRLDQTNPAIDSTDDFQNVATPPTEVLSILRDACFDCHSFESKYPWYAQVAPASWWLASHINEGRERLNFSEFGKLPPSDRSEILGEAAEAFKEGEMPLPSYTWFGLHPEANLSSAQHKVLLQWLEANGAERGREAGEGIDDAD